MINAKELGKPFERRPLLIAQMDMPCRDGELQSRLEQTPEWVLVVCDESQRLSAHGFGSEAKPSKHDELGKRLGKHAHNPAADSSDHGGDPQQGGRQCGQGERTPSQTETVA